MLVSTKKPGDVIVLTMGETQARVYIFRPRKRKGRIIIGIQAPEHVVLQEERFHLEEKQIAS